MVCLCLFILQFYVLDFLLNCSFLFTDKLLCLVVHEVDCGDPVEYEATEAKVSAAMAALAASPAHGATDGLNRELPHLRNKVICCLKQANAQQRV